MVPLIRSSPRSSPSPVMMVLPVPLPTMFTLSLTSKSPVWLSSPPLPRLLMPKVPLTVKLMVSVPGLLLAWPTAQRKLPETGISATNRSEVVVTL